MHRRIEARIVNDLLGTTIEAPSYATDGSAAMDLRACLSEAVTLPAGGRTLVKTGLAINQHTDVFSVTGHRRTAD